MQRVRLTQLDGKLPNLALMKLAHWHRAQGDEVVFTRRPDRDFFEPEFDVVYGSAIFTRTMPTVERFRRAFPGALVGGTGTGATYTVEDVIGGEYERYDYTDYPGFAPSIGFTQRGCRFSCGWCVVPGKEGRPKPVNTIPDIWRGEGHPRKLHLLDNDFFGQPREEWEARLEEIRSGGFRVCLNQGINIRVISPAAAEALSTVEYRDDGFTERRLYTAWDNVGDERVFFRGVDRLEKAGIPPQHIMAYMLVGFDPAETMERVLYRFHRMADRGVLPYPMVYDDRQLGDRGPSRSLGTFGPGEDGAARFRKLKQLQRWAIHGLYRDKETPFEAYDSSIRGRRRDREAQFTLEV
ncbi:MAG: hypothetical protein AB1941_10010 [Gemmatimonadota bacterium]